MTELEEKALMFAREKHQNQTYGDFPFVLHPVTTAGILREVVPHDENLICAGYLHDTLEDTETTYEELVEEFNKDIADLVKEVTKTESNTFPNLTTQRGVILKFADRLCNVAHMDGWSEERKQKYLFEKSKFWK